MAIAHESLRGAGDNKTEELGKQMYSELTDGAHPTQWGLVGYSRVRDDGLGIDYQRRPLEGLPGSLG